MSLSPASVSAWASGEERKRDISTCVIQPHADLHSTITFKVKAQGTNYIWQWSSTFLGPQPRSVEKNFYGPAGLHMHSLLLQAWNPPYCLPPWRIVCIGYCSEHQSSACSWLIANESQIMKERYSLHFKAILARGPAPYLMAANSIKYSYYVSGAQVESCWS